MLKIMRLQFNKLLLLKWWVGAIGGALWAGLCFAQTPSFDESPNTSTETHKMAQSLAELQTQYQSLKQRFQRIYLNNQEYCKEAAALAAACPMSLPISPRFFSPNICENNGFGPYEVKATVRGGGASGGRWKIRINQTYISSAFSGEDAPLTFTSENELSVATHQTLHAFLPFKNMTRLELLPQAGTSASSGVTLQMTAGDHTIFSGLSFSLQGSPQVWLADLRSSLSGAKSRICNPVFEEIQARVDETVREQLNALP